MTVTSGRIVHVFADRGWNDGIDFAPAIITRVWTPDLINVHVWWNGPPVPPPGRTDWLQQIPLYPDRDSAELAHLERWAGVDAGYRPAPSRAAWWPPRTLDPREEPRIACENHHRPRITEGRMGGHVL